MSGQSLGLIETVGLAAAIEAADAAIKSANVELVGYELSKGGGMITVKLKGDVGAINAAVSAGVAAANKMGQIWAYRVIPRTAKGIESIIHSTETITDTTLPATKSDDSHTKSEPDTTVSENKTAENNIYENNTSENAVSESSNPEEKIQDNREDSLPADADADAKDKNTTKAPESPDKLAPPTPKQPRRRTTTRRPPEKK